MGQCGCGDFCGEFTLKAPNGGLYVFGRYQPCPYCETPLGLVVTHLTGKDIEFWDADKLPQLAMQKAPSERLIPILSREQLVDALKGIKLKDLYDNGEAYEDLSDFFEDDGIDILTKAMFSKAGWTANWSPDEKEGHGD